MTTRQLTRAQDRESSQASGRRSHGTATRAAGLMNAARQLSPRDRDKFLRHTAAVLAAMPVRGDGSVWRAINTEWRQRFDPGFARRRGEVPLALRPRR